jgi:hypothetical protein
MMRDVGHQTISKGSGGVSAAADPSSGTIGSMV